MMEMASRLKRLGTETAFAVSAEANAHIAAGNRVYPFHLGDMNLPTPENIMEAAVRAMRGGKTGYCSNLGIPELRAAIAEDLNRTHGTHYAMENVTIQPGGKPTIGKFILALMEPGDEVLYPNPGYPIYESQIEFHGGVAVPYAYREGEKGFELDLEGLEKSITSKTRVLILNDLQNPTGAEASPRERERLAEIARKHDLKLLLDEAYFHIRYEGTSTSLASLEGIEERSVILYTFSKRFAMTGWRIGAAVGPEHVADAIGKLNVNDESCSNHFVQYGALEGLRGGPAGTQRIVGELRRRRDRCVELLNDIPGIRCARPQATFYLFPNVTEVMRRLGLADYETFRRTILRETGVSFCTRLHFGRPLPGETQKYIRFAYSGIDLTDIEEGLGLLKGYIARAS
ncbi:MAG: aminotransferase class I/II-fold pyridoxal phosphate-dependent enzyme [Planctomycetes bacterium]|nr:aminotransferase class I/II-fold pyridoxal phosphate-dependent enzyme [Planctomycetota bacterium]